MNLDKKYFSIGEVSKLKKVTIKALRYYHEIGLLVPSYIDETNGYRYYTLDQFDQIDIIKICRSLGVSIKELQVIFANKDPLYLSQFMREKSQEIKIKIQELEEVQSELQILTNKVEASLALIHLDDFEIQYFPKRYAITVPIQQLDTRQEVMGYMKLDEKLEEHGFETRFEHGIYYQLSTSGNWQPSHMFELIEPSNKQDSNLMKLPDGYFLTCSFSNENEKYRFEELKEYLNVKELVPEFMLALELYHAVIEADKYYYQIQVYIGKMPLSTN